jgi:intracellular septation protein
LASQFIGDKPLVQRMMSKALDIDDVKIWAKLNMAWVGFFIISGLANVLVAPEIDPLNLNFSLDTWVEFKLFGLLGLTIIFVLAQAFYLARYMPSENKETH